jgi:hypothetical protein
MIAGRKIDGLILSKIILVGTCVRMYPFDFISSIFPVYLGVLWSVSVRELTHKEDTNNGIVLTAYKTKIFFERAQTSCGNVVPIQVVENI